MSATINVMQSLDHGNSTHKQQTSKISNTHQTSKHISQQTRHTIASCSFLIWTPVSLSFRQRCSRVCRRVTQILHVIYAHRHTTADTIVSRDLCQSRNCCRVVCVHVSAFLPSSFLVLKQANNGADARKLHLCITLLMMIPRILSSFQSNQDLHSSATHTVYQISEQVREE